MSQTLLTLSSEAKKYWEKELQQPLPVLNLPLGLSKKGSEKEQVDTVSFSLTGLTETYVINWAKDIQTNVPVFFVSTYFLLLYRLTNEKDLIVGVTTGENQTVPVRVSFENCDTFLDLLRQIHQKLERAVAFGDYKWNELIVEDQPFYTAFSFGSNSHSYDTYLDVEMNMSADCLELKMNYDADRLSKDTVDRYGLYLSKIIDATLSDSPSSVRIDAIEIISEEEKEMYRRLQRPVSTNRQMKAIHERFQSAVQKHPERIAISTEQCRLTYRELDERSNQVAHLLLENGLEKEGLVPIFMRRSLDTIITLLGVLKAGGAYVPLDPDHPAERNQYILKDTAADFAIVHSSCLPLFEQLSVNRETLKVFTEEDSQSCSREAVEVHVDPDQLAYMIYTSGSTGQPKGALIGHRGVVNLIDWSTKEMKFTEQDALCQFAPYSFDASVYDTFNALFNGACLYLLSDEERMSVVAFAKAIEREEITSIAILPTIFFNELINKLPQEYIANFKRIRQIAIGGEALKRDYVTSFEKKFGSHINIYNLYGPTECTVAATFYKVHKQMPATPTVPIGHPVDNYALYVVNDHHQLCPLGVPGELLISTVGVAKGYLRQAEKTAAAFVPNHFEDGLSSTLYRSGDIVRLLPTGELEYVSRKDSQVKIRGHRIEIGEVEEALSKHESLKDVAVIVKPDEEGLNMLVAFYTSVTGEELTALELRDFLSGKLPKYMIPAHIQHVMIMPVSPTGKIDLRALANYEIEKTVMSEVKHVPQTDTEKLVAEAWKTTLKLDEIDIHDNFFEIGGHSLKIIETLVLLKPNYPQLKINDFFLYPTIAQLAVRALELSQETVENEKREANSEVIDLPEQPAIFGSFDTASLLKQQNVLLTGATGYLGSHILQQLLVTTEANVYCLVRGASADQARERLLNMLAHYFDHQISEKMLERLTVLTGDLAEANLGLSSVDCEYLEGQIDTIIHCGADVRHYGESDHFSKVNKQSTEALLAFARKKSGLRFHFISTLGIPEDLAAEGKWDASKGIDELHNISLDNVYVNSKFDSEKILLKAAQEEGIPISIYRAGNLTCHSENGRFQKNIDSNAYYRMMKTMLALKTAPKVDWYVDFTPIDYASAAIVSLSNMPETAGRLMHICNHEQIHYSNMIETLEKCGYLIQLKDEKEYEQWLFSDNGIDPEVLQLTIAQLEGDGAKNSNYRYTCPETIQLLQKTKVKCPVANEEFMRKMIDHAVQIGYFPKP
ncbi:amino acid adenylation domain-containing protein [Bacillus sp. FJAT-52991]|uniref:Amino acid adenylation domain-containing protein n=1 Tax=Bacillus kandeliae TaxID=3129297 RepID=A0ABZ2N583_9BACI